MRRLAAIAALLLVVLCTGAAEAVPPRSHVQVVAHPDDDILFMNPDLSIAIRSGATVTTVFLTAGESDVPWPERYAAQRQAGARAAFAAMAGVADIWRRTRIPLSGGQAELQTLRGRPAVHLVFLNLPDDNNPRATGGKHALTRLWHDETTLVGTTQPEGTALAPSRYGRASVIGALSQLYRQFSPGIVRTHDPEPDPRFQPQWENHDHPDHVMTARFAEAALHARPSAHLIHYRDYNTADAPPNLPPEVVAEKRAIFERYAAHDAEVGLGDPYATWLRSMRQRWPWTTNWISTSGGRPQYVYAQRGKLIKGDGSEESVVDTPGFEAREGSASFAAPGVLVAQDRETGAIFREHGQRAWQSMGAPPAQNPRTHVGTPAAATTADGRTLVAARNVRGGVSIRFSGGPGWTDLGGTGVDSTVSVVRGGNGDMHVFAPARNGLLHWRADDTGGELVSPPETHRPAGPVAVAHGTHAFAAFREAGTGRIVVIGENVGWSRVAVIDPPTAITSDPALAVLDGDTPLVAARDTEGRVTVLGPTPAVLPGFAAAQPAFTPDGSHLAFLGDDGRIHVRTRGRKPLRRRGG